jgi:hypothetical protein
MSDDLEPLTTDPADLIFLDVETRSTVEGLTLQALQAAHDVARTPQEFWLAVQCSIWLKERVKG